MLPLYPLTEAQKCLYIVLPLAYSCNLLLARTWSSVAILEEPKILDLLVCVCVWESLLHRVDGKAEAERS